MTRRRNPITNQMIDIWDDCIMLIDEIVRLEPDQKFLYSSIDSRNTKSLNQYTLKSFSNLLLEGSWYILRLAVGLMYETKEEVIQRTGDLEIHAVGAVVTSRGAMYDRTIAFMDSAIDAAIEISESEKPEDLIDFSFMLHQLHQICNAIILDIQLNPDRLRVKTGLGLSINDPVWKVLELQPKPATFGFHRYLENDLWTSEELRHFRNAFDSDRMPPGFTWVSWWEV